MYLSPAKSSKYLFKRVRILDDNSLDGSVALMDQKRMDVILPFDNEDAWRVLCLNQISKNIVQSHQLLRLTSISCTRHGHLVLGVMFTRESPHF